MQLSPGFKVFKSHEEAAAAFNDVEPVTPLRLTAPLLGDAPALPVPPLTGVRDDPNVPAGFTWYSPFMSSPPLCPSDSSNPSDPDPDCVENCKVTLPASGTSLPSWSITSADYNLLTGDWEVVATAMIDGASSTNALVANGCSNPAITYHDPAPPPTPFAGYPAGTVLTIRGTSTPPSVATNCCDDDWRIMSNTLAIIHISFMFGAVTCDQTTALATLADPLAETGIILNPYGSYRWQSPYLAAPTSNLLPPAHIVPTGDGRQWLSPHVAIPLICDSSSSSSSSESACLPGCWEISDQYTVGTDPVGEYDPAVYVDIAVNKTVVCEGDLLTITLTYSSVEDPPPDSPFFAILSVGQLGSPTLFDLVSNTPFDSDWPNPCPGQPGTNGGRARLINSGGSYSWEIDWECTEGNVFEATFLIGNTCQLVGNAAVQIVASTPNDRDRRFIRFVTCCGQEPPLGCNTIMGTCCTYDEEPNAVCRTVNIGICNALNGTWTCDQDCVEGTCD